MRVNWNLAKQRDVLLDAGDEEEPVSTEEQRAEAGELMGLQRLYVTTALSNQPRGEMSRPPEVPHELGWTLQAS